MSNQKFRVQDGIVFPDGTEQTTAGDAGLSPELTKVGGNLVSTTTLEFQGQVYGTMFDIDSGGNFDVWLQSVTGDGTGKSYAIGSNDDGYNFVYAFNATGSVAWKVGLDDITGNDNTAYAIKHDNGYLYLICQYYNNDIGENQMSVVKLNAADGTISTSWVLGRAGITYRPADIAVNSSGDPVVVGRTYGDTQTFTGLTPQAGSGPQVLVVNASDLNNYPQTNPWGSYYVHTDPNDPNAWYNTYYNVNWFLNVPTTVVTGNGDGNLRVNLRYMYNSGDSQWHFDWCEIANGGSGYVDPDQVKVLGSAIGGTDGVDDVILSRNSWYMNILSVGGVATNVCPSFVSEKVRLNTSQNVDYSTGTWDVRVGLNSQAFVWTPNWEESYGTADDDQFRSVAVDSSDNIYLLGNMSYNDGSNWHNVLAMKLDDNGAQQWAKYIEDDTYSSNDAGSIFLDNSGNIYTISENNNGYTLVTKLDGNGDLVWQAKQTDNNNWNNYPVGGIDASGQIFVMGSWYNGNNYVTAIHKLSSSDGALQMSRNFANQQDYDMYEYYDEDGQAGTVVGSNFYYGGYCYDANDDQYVGFGFRLPVDGTGTGTYGRYVYSDNSDTEYSDNTSNAVLTSHSMSPVNTSLALQIPDLYASVTADDVGNTTVHKWSIGTGGGLAGVDSITFGDGTVQTTAAGSAITWTNPNSNVWRIETYNSGASRYYGGSDYDACWFHMDNSPSGMNNFRGAIIQYHAYIDGLGNIIGTIHLSNDFTQESATHTEHLSGNSDLQYATLWDCNWERGQLFFKMTNGNSRSIMVQWTATVFYGSENNC